MQQIINGKLYDTETAELISKEQRSGVDHNETDEVNGGHTLGAGQLNSEWTFTSALYRSKKGQYFVVDTTNEKKYSYTKGSFFSMSDKATVSDPRIRDCNMRLLSIQEAFAYCQARGLNHACNRITNDVEEG